VSETRKLAAILAADIVGYSRLAAADEDRILARLRTLRSDLIDPMIAVHHGRVVKRTGDGSIIEFRSVVDAVRCAIEVQSGLAERNAGLPPEKRIEYRVGIHLGDVVEEADGDLMGDGVNIAARLEGVASPGAICLSEQAYWQVKGRLDLKVSDLGATQLKNIAEPIRVYSLEVGQPTEARPASGGSSGKPGPPRLSLVVLPFANIGNDPEQECFADGVTESLTTDLSRISGAFVIARNTAFTYKGKAADVKQIGRDLNVRYALEGSVQRGGGRMRVNVQLIDAETGSHLWAERFDKTVADLFDMQDQIVSRLANRLGQELLLAEATRAERASNPDSMDHYFLGLGYYNKPGAEFLDKARSHFDRALELDPQNVDALIRRAWVDLTLAGYYLTDDRTERFRSAESDLAKALRLRPDSAAAHAALGNLCVVTNRVAEGVAECERALAIDPNCASAHVWIGAAKSVAGRSEENEAHIVEALRISPRDIHAGNWMVIAAFAKVCASRDEDAVVWCNRSIGLNPNDAGARFCLAAALANLGRLEEARDAAHRGLKISPSFTIARFRSAPIGNNRIYLAGLEHVWEGMRKAGLPEE
jgi:TolB-like protein/class 3 adenylate cyclase/Flp pilus assembly protein TadD